MPRPREVVCCFFAVMFSVWFAGAWRGPGTSLLAGDPESYVFDRLNGAERERIDAAAREATVRDSKVQRQVETYSDVSAYLISRVVLPEGEEERRAEEEHEKLVKEFAVVETPADAAEVFRRLVEQLPAEIVPVKGGLTLTVVDDPGRGAFTLGGTRVYVTRQYLEAVGDDPDSRRGRLAFALAHEMGHICRKHTRRRYQLEWILEQADSAIDEHAKTKLSTELSKLWVHGAGGAVDFLYSLEEALQADLFAVHLCRNAGLTSDAMLDPIRERIVAGGWNGPSRGGVSFNTTRLRAALNEREGVMSSAEFGLFRFNPRTGETTPLGEKELTAGGRAIVFIHGMESDPVRFRRMAAGVADGSAELLALRYPNDGSLARSGIFLRREVERVCANASGWDFVCHSAGGLVFRWYAEVEQGAFRRAVLLGTPNGGSSLARLRTFLEIAQFLGDLRFGYDEALREALLDSKGQMAEDLREHSLFLTWLNRPREGDAEIRERYTIVRGRALKRRYAVALVGAVAAGKIALKHQLAKKGIGAGSTAASESLLKRQIAWGVDHLRVPEEITGGDLAVTLESADLELAGRVETVAKNHLQLMSDPVVVDAVRGVLAGE